jgi:polysaccharide export outer membrane protein
MVKKILAFWLALLLAGLTALAFCQENYRLGPEDQIEIRVWDHEDLTRKLQISLDGGISYPFVGEIKAQGMTVLELQKELERRLAQGYIVEPHVSIAVLDYKSQKFFVVGNVQKPGTYPLTRPITVTEAISQAGGLAIGSGKPLTGAMAIIVRPQKGEKPKQPRMPEQSPPGQKVTVSLSAAYSGDPRHNVEIKNGDTIYVPSLIFYVSGEVKRPGRYPYEENMTVLMAVATAEGLTDRASTRGIYIVREQGGTKEKIRAKMEDLIQPGDTIVVPESFF